MKPTIRKTSNRPYELGVKRFYAPYTVTQYCEECKENKEFDLTDYSLYDPIINSPAKMSFTCQDCYEELPPIRLQIDVDVKIVEEDE